MSSLTHFATGLYGASYCSYETANLHKFGNWFYAVRYLWSRLWSL